jgi:hypothetical protein
VRNGIYPGALMAMVFLVAATPLTAQPGSFEQGVWWLGYAANAPRQLLGVGTAVLRPEFGGWGIYADMKITPDSPARGSYRADLTPDDAIDFGDVQASQQSAWTSVNAALVKVLGPEFAIYVGGGLGERTMYLQFADDSLERDESGIYWVEDESQSGRYVNGMAGMFFRLAPRFVFQMGAETAPGGFTAGMHIVLR